MYQWKSRFTQNTLDRGKELFSNGRVQDFTLSSGKCTAEIQELKRYSVKILKRITQQEYGMSCTCPIAVGGGVCKHMAAVLYAMEDYENQMQRKEEAEVNRQQEADRTKAVEAQAVRMGAVEVDKARAEEQDDTLPAVPDEAEYIVLGGKQEVSQPLPRYWDEEYRYFNCEAIRNDLEPTNEVLRKSREIYAEEAVKIVKVDTGYSEYDNDYVALIHAMGRRKKDSFRIQLMVSQSEVRNARCECAECRKYWYSRDWICPYTVAVLQLFEDYLDKNSVGDATDKTGSMLINNFSHRHINQLVSEAAKGSRRLALLPRLVKKREALELSFRIGCEKLFIVKDLFKFYQNVLDSETDIYGSSTSLNHDRANFTEEGRMWIDFLGSIVQEEKAYERRLQESSVYYTKRALSAKGALELHGWRLDRFYELACVSAVEYVDRENPDKSTGRKGTLGSKQVVLQCGEGDPEVQVSIQGMEIDDKGTFHGIDVLCRFEKLYIGSGKAYHLDGQTLRRGTKEFLDCMQPLVRLGDEGELCFRIGRNHLADFYHTMLPAIRKFAQVTVFQAEEIEQYLSPEAEFVFYLDAENHNITCKLMARYGEKEYFVITEDGYLEEAFRQILRENEMFLLVKQWLPQIDQENHELHCGQDEEVMYRFLENGVDALLSLGEVHCTRRFSNLKLARKVKIAVGVSVSQGLLNLDISTEDISQEELLDILKSYRLKKKYHRLRNGDYVSLEEEALALISRVMDSSHITAKDFLKGNLHLPLYRALYLDKLLEEHESVYQNRDSHFKELVKDFKTINDSDFEEPRSLSKVMRGYQKAGYRWMRMLEEYHFGGILADDMGLGKTLQVIAVLLSAKKEDRDRTALVVTPASLVFNWGEELRRFAPELSTSLIIGSQEERRSKIEQYRNFDVLVTSYDLLKRDIAFYEDKVFKYQIIDEAQYIKNHTTAAAKAVKVIQSDIRYALTGTPIENRLSELWSIFDYLMPGFLYGYDAFRKEFESPIVKNEDKEVSGRLQRMVSPFILRRLKENVLKDLPDKLEEIRYVKFDGEQQRLYDAQVVRMRQMVAAQDGEEFSKNKIQVLAELTRLRQICCDPGLCYLNYTGESAKSDACMELIGSATEGGHKILLFSQFTSMLELLEERMEDAGVSFYKITGETPKEKRLQLVKAFNEDDTQVFLISLKAGGVGLNLTGADVVIHYDPWWNLAVQNQATDRAHRIGQTKKVVVYKLLAKNSVEEKIQKLQETKKNLADQIVGGDRNQLSAMSREDFLALLDS